MVTWASGRRCEGVWPEADEQRCWNHRILNILDKLPKQRQSQGTLMLKRIPRAQTRKEAERLKQVFQAWCRKHGCEQAAQLIDQDWERMVTFYSYPKEHWLHLRTSNPIESPFSRVRLRTDASRRYKKIDNATALIWKTLMIAEKRFRKLNAPDVLQEVYNGVLYANGVRVENTQEELAA